MTDQAPENRWWPTLSARLAALAEGGATLSPSESYRAQEERAAAQRRAASRQFVKRSEIVLRPSSHANVWLGDVVSAAMGRESHILQCEIQHIPAGCETTRHRHGERVCFVMSGSGTMLIEDGEVPYEPGDAIHIKNGAWHAFRADGTDPTNLLVGSATALIEKMVAFPLVYKGDSYSDVPESFQPQHPFGLGPQAIPTIDGEKWNSSVHQGRKERLRALEERSRTARTHISWRDARIERSHHKGDFKVALIDATLGFDVRSVTMAMHQMPPDSFTETHRHAEAVVFVLSGKGYSIVDGERYDWEAGDCMHIQPGAWHQHFNTDPTHVSQQLAILPTPLFEQLTTFRGFEEEGEATGAAPAVYDPKLPWEFDVTVPWPQKP